MDKEEGENFQNIEAEAVNRDPVCMEKQESGQWHAIKSIVVVKITVKINYCKRACVI